MSYIRTNEAELIIKEINSLIKDYYIRDEDRNLYKFSSEINNILRSVFRVKNELESGIFFIAASGGLKSGKSTLVNLLSHYNVSVTKQGQETTLRPSIVFSGKENKIITFTLKNSKIEEERKGDIFDLCIDYIKGFDKLNIDKILSENNVEIKSYKLIEKNLESFLTKASLGTTKEPFLVGIQLDENDLKKYKYNLLNRKVAFIDTPGIDGITSSVEGQNNKSESRNNWLMQRVDLMLFLQSSITPINSTSKNYIENLVSSLDSPSLKLIHNQFSLKSWRKEILKIDNDYESDYIAIEKAKRVLTEVIDSTDLDTFIVDFAKAEDGFKYKNADLLKQSKFEDFEENLFQIIKDNRAKIHEEKIFKNLEKIIKTNTKLDEKTNKVTIRYVENKILEVTNKINSEKMQYINYLNLIEEFFTKTDEIKFYIENEKLDSQEVDDGWELDSTAESLKSRDWSEELTFKVNSKIEDLDSLLNNVNIAIEEKIKTQLKNNKFNNFLDHCYISKELKFKDARTYINDSIDNINVIPFIFKYENEIKSLDIKVDDIYSKDDGIISKMKNIFKDKLTQEELSTIKTTFNTLCKQRIDKRIGQYKTYLFDEIDRQFSEYVDYIGKIKSDVDTHFDNKYKDELARLKNSSDRLNQLKTFFDKLEKMV